MAEAFVGEIRMFAGNFAPVGWALCQGQLVQISENEALFQLIGTTYGGNGTSNFALPNLQSRVPMHASQNYILGQIGGVEAVTLTVQQIASHTHAVAGRDGGSVTSPSGAFPGVVSGNVGANIYETAIPPDTAMNPATIGYEGQSLPHENIQPYLAVNFIISLYGIFPSQS